MTVCPVLESIRVVTGSQRHETVFAFSRLVTTQCSMTSAVGGGIWLRSGAGGGGGGDDATGFFLAAQPAREKIQNRNRMDQNFLVTTDGSTRPNITPLGDGTYSVGGAGLHEIAYSRGCPYKLRFGGNAS